MAKQSGLHQIRGKVGEHSYYKQTGVSSGLIRSINPGMSARVKTAAEYVNTRLNNAEFGQACRIAGVLGQFVIPKYRPMILPFSQSKMAKILIEAIRTKVGEWGTRNLGSDDLESLLKAINSTRKNNPDSWGLSYSVNSDDEFVIASDEVLFPSKLQSIGADGVKVITVAARPWIGIYKSSTGRYAESYARANIYEEYLEQGGSQINLNWEFRPAPPAGWPADYVDFMVVVIIPYRTINDTEHDLQEHCTFIAMALPEQA